MSTAGKVRRPPPAEPASLRCRQCGAALAEGSLGLCARCQPRAPDTTIYGLWAHREAAARAFAARLDAARREAVCEQPTWEDARDMLREWYGGEAIELEGQGLPPAGLLAYPTANGLACERNAEWAAVSWRDVLAAIGWREPEEAEVCDVEDFFQCEEQNMTAIQPQRRAARGQQTANGVLNTSTPAGIRAHEPEAMSTRSEKAAEGGASAESLAVRVDLEQISPNPWQPRSEFAEEELVRLAESLERQGQVQPIVVRPAPHGSATRYQLVCGERRVRAARRLGWTAIRAEIAELSDAQVEDLALTENAQRQDLGPLEQARAWRRWLERPGEDGAPRTQEQLARLVGCTASHISLISRLVELPEAIQKRVVAREMPPTHARCLLPYVEAPAVLAKVEKHLAERGALGSLKDWERTLSSIVREASEPLSRGVHTNAGGYQWGEVRIDAKDPRREALQIVEVKGYGGLEKRCLNAPLARKILSEKAAAWKAKHEKKEQAGTKEKGAKSKAAAKQKAQAAAEARKELVTDWLHDLVADHLAQHGIDDGLRLRLVVFAAANADWCDTLNLYQAKPWGDVAVLKEHVDRRLVEFFHTPADGRGHGWMYGGLEEHDLAELVALLKIVPAKAWAARGPQGQAFAGPLTEKLWSHYSVEQLRELCGEWKIAGMVEGKTHAELVRLISTQAKHLPLPAELAELLPRRRGKRAK